LSTKNPDREADKCNTKQFDMTDLIFKENDDYKTLVIKNSKLRNLVVKASEKINEMTNEFTEKEKDYEFEKTTILKELDNISSNYKKYANCYKSFSILDEQYRNLQRDYNHNYNVMMAYQDTLRYEL
jgi:acyl carrier protein phosphodiesterase